jgi:ATP-dependent helicase/nuclease subunit A
MAIAGAQSMTAPVEHQRIDPTPEQRLAADPRGSVWVAASAGSGKTRVLVDRVIRLLLEGAAPDSILCLTFTKTAAAEMADRLFRRLSGWVALDDGALNQTLHSLGVENVSADVRGRARRLFAQALETPGGLKIQTIHAFCERLLQAFPVESGLAPGFSVMDSQQTSGLFREAMLTQLLSDSSFAETAWSFLEDGAVLTLDALEGLAKPFLAASNGMRQRLENFDRLSETTAELKMLLGIKGDRSLHEIETEICAIDVAAYQKIVTIFSPLEFDAKPSVPGYFQMALNASTHEERITSFILLLFTEKGTPRKSLLRSPARKAHPGVAGWFDGERSRLTALLVERAGQQILTSNIAIYKAMASVLAQVNIAKRSQGLYDFDDLIAKAAQLLSNPASAQWVLYKLDKGLTHILVDEAQDTSPAQWSIITALAQEFFSGEQAMGVKRTMFAVGDLKQSIYSFQGADIDAFEAARQNFSSLIELSQDKLRKVDLSVSYRSNQQVLDAVDAVFARGRSARTGFGHRADAERPHTAHNKQQGLVELWDLELAEEREERDHWQAPIDLPAKSHPRLKLAERIASTIESWIGKRELTGQGRAVQAGDILILLQSRNVLFNALIGALRRRGVPVAGADRLKLQSSLIVQDFLMLVQWLRLPDDDHALACVLKSPLVPDPLDDDGLFDLAHDRGVQSLWSRLPAKSENRKLLEDVLQSRDTPFMLLSRVLQRSRRAILERLGQEADDAAQEFLSQALDYEKRNGVSLTGFADWFVRGETEIKREMEASGGNLRIMTVHGSKGLEAPIVFLADAADPPPGKRDRLIDVADDGQHGRLLLFDPRTDVAHPIMTTLKDAEKDRALSERKRLLYVGMTRAADELYICGSLNKDDENKVNAESWHALVMGAFGDHHEKRRVLRDDGSTLWRFGAEPNMQQQTVEITAARGPLPDWATKAVPHPTGAPLPLTASRRSKVFDKEAAKRGLASHRLAEVMADVAGDDRIETGLRWARKLGLEADMVQRLASAMSRPDLAPLFSTEGQSEVSIEGELSSHGRVSGRIDRLFVGSDEIMILDFKTNRSPITSLPVEHEYIRQMAIYADLLRQAYPRHGVKAALLWTQTGEISWLSSSLLSQSLELSAQETS